MVTWRSSAEDVDQVLAGQNPWHRVGVVSRALAPPVERTLAGRLVTRLHSAEPRRFHVILGPRRVGKTTVMYQTARRLLDGGVEPARLWWLRMDHPVLMRESLGDLVSHVVSRSDARHGREVFLFLDELVYAEQWDLWLKTFFDEQWPVQVLATSSATAALRGRRVESGVGRWDEHHLMPYLFSEYVDLVGVDDRVTPAAPTLTEALAQLTPADDPGDRFADHRRRFVLVGGFPELIVRDQAGSEDDTDADRLLISQRVLRNDTVERAVYKDIPQLFGIDNPMLLERLLYTLAGNITGVISPGSICAELDQLSQPTFDRYVSYLEQTFIVLRLPNYAGTESAIQRRGRKLYFHDGAVRNAALQRGVAPLTDPHEMGLLIENLAAATLHTLALRTGSRLHHWRERRTEVDLVLDHPTQPLAVEVTTSERHSISGLEALVQRHPRFAGRTYLAAPGVPVRQPHESARGVGAIPLDLFLLIAGRQAEQAI